MGRWRWMLGSSWHSFRRLKSASRQATPLIHDKAHRSCAVAGFLQQARGSLLDDTARGSRPVGLNFGAKLRRLFPCSCAARAAPWKQHPPGWFDGRSTAPELARPRRHRVHARREARHGSRSPGHHRRSRALQRAGPAAPGALVGMPVLTRTRSGGHAGVGTGGGHGHRVVRAGLAGTRRRRGFDRFPAGAGVPAKP